MNIYKMPLEQFQVNTKFLNTLLDKWSKFVTDVKLVKDLHTTNVDQLHAYLEQHERHANEVRLMHEHNSDPLALVASRKVFTNIGYIWRPTGRTFTIVGSACPLTRITTTTEVPLRKLSALDNKTPKPVVTLVYSRKPRKSKTSVLVNNYKVVQIVLWYLDSGCSKHMTEDRSQLTNFVNKFLGTVKFSNDHVAKIMGYGDYQIGNVTILKVYYVEGLGQNLFSMG
ncbi:hypothetical protein Tco_0817606 [Tanacetum coccineum]